VSEEEKKENTITVSTAKGGVSFLSLLTLLFIGLKLFGRIDWDWVWVLAPMWAPWAFVLAVLALVGFFILAIVCLVMGWEWWKGRG